MPTKKNKRFCDIAVIGGAFRFPGDISSPEDFYRALAGKRDAVSLLPEGRFSLSRYFSAASNLAGRSYTRAAGTISLIRHFDPDFFGCSRKEAQDMDPQQRMALEMTWEALERGHILPSSIRGENVGVFMGASAMDCSMRSHDDPELISPYSMTGSTLGIIANRISYFFDLHGPSFTVDTACSSSLVAVHQACEALRSGDIPLAVAGGVNVLLAPYPFIGFSRANMLAPDGRCKVFDASGNGYVRSEGGGVVILKPLSKAMADGDGILAVIAGSGVNSDGRTNGISLPNGKAQAALLRKIYTGFALDLNNLVYVEAHGTGTAVGDPIEASALGEVLGKPLQAVRNLHVGSVKGNIGHLEAGAGMAGLMKSILTLQSGKIFPNLHITELNPAIDFTGMNITVPTELTDLPTANGNELIGVNSFGFGGTNAHVVLRKAPPPPKSKLSRHRGDKLPPLFLSAKSQASLCTLAERYLEVLPSAENIERYDIAASTAFSRDHLDIRAVVFGDTTEEQEKALRKLTLRRDVPAIKAVREPASGTRSGVFAFSGNGSQYLGMGRELLRDDAVFREALEKVDALLLPLQAWSLLDVLANPHQHEEEFADPAQSQRLLFAMQVGIVTSLQARGLEPAAVIGHSVGEIAAAWAAGALSLEDAVKVLHARSTSQIPLRNRGSMAVANIDEAKAKELLEPYNGKIAVAAVNADASLTLSGESESLRAIVAECKRRKLTAKMLELPYPFHSSFMDVAKAGLLTALTGIAPKRPKIIFYSTVSGKRVRNASLGVDYWWKNVRQPVLFRDAVNCAFADGFRLFLEVTPNAVLGSYLRDILGKKREAFFVGATLKSKKETSLEGVWQNAWENGWTLDLQKHFPFAHTKRALPTYPWNREYLWADNTPEGREYLTPERLHPLLGWQCAGAAPMFQNTIHLADYPWLADHAAGNVTPYPAAAFIESALAAAKVFPGERRELERVSITRPLNFSTDTAKVLRIGIDREDGGFVLEAREHMSAEAWSACAKGRIIATAPGPVPQNLAISSPAAFGTEVPGAEVYTISERFMMRYGEAFRTVNRVWVRPHASHPEILAELGSAIPESCEGMLIPPTLLDGAFQTLFLLLGKSDGEQRQAYLPAAFERVTLYAAGIPKFAVARLDKTSTRSVLASFQLFDQDGKALLFLKGCRFRRASWLESRQVPSSAYVHKLKALPCSNHIETPGIADGSCEAGTLEGLAVQTLVDAAAPQIRDNDAIRAAQSERDIPAHRFLQFVALEAMHETVFSFLTEGKGGATEGTVGEGAGQSALADCRDLMQKGLLAPSAEPWFRHMLERLTGAGLAVKQGEGWTVTSRHDRPNLLAVWCSLLQNASYCLSETALLAHLLVVGRKILMGDFADNEESILPSRLVTQYFDSSVWLRPLTDAIAACLKKVIAHAGSSQAVEILQASHTSSGLLTALLPLLEEHECLCTVEEKNEETARSNSILFSHAPFVRFEPYTLDPSSASSEHGASDKRYHLIILSCSLHAKLNIAAALAQYRSRLLPGGFVVLAEHTPSLFADYVLGARPSWWAASLDVENPVSRLQEYEFWEHALTGAGFEQVEAVKPDDTQEDPGFLLIGRNPASVSVQSCVEQPAGHADRQFLLVSRNQGTQSALLADQLAAAFHARGIATFQTRLDRERDYVLEEIPAALKQNGNLEIVYLAGYDTQEELSAHDMLFFQKGSLAGLAGLLHGVENIRQDERLSRLWIVTGGAMSGDVAAARPVVSQGATAGFGRVLANEGRPLDVRLLDIHGDIHGADFEKNCFTGMLYEILQPHQEREIVLAGGVRYVPRLSRLNIKETGGSVGEIVPAERSFLAFDAPGRLQNLHWKKDHLIEPEADEVCIAVRYAGLNFRDVMWAMGLLHDEALENGFSGPGLGIECSGVIVSVGSGVTGWFPGDEVVCFAPACFSTHVVTKASALARKPSNISFAEAATLPVPFITAWYSLKHIARMQPGESVLIHGAAGGVGLAAVQIANILGLTIHATAGAAEKQNFLRALGVKHIYSSRSLDFSEQVLAATGGRGVDAVLNSLSGEAISAGLATLRPFGRFIELGKRDFYADSPMRLQPFSNNLSYFGVDVDQLLIHQPDLAQKLFAELMNLFVESKLTPLPHTVYPAGKVVDAFQTMQQAAHIGKIVVALEDAPALVTTTRFSHSQRMNLTAAGTYLISGGSSGLGLASAVRLAERGAKHLLLLSRNGAQDDESQALIAELVQSGVQVVDAKTDVSDAVALGRCLRKHLAQMPPLRGVIHAAAALDDGLISRLTPARIKNALAAKSLGAWNLHMATQSYVLDFFVLYSSATTPFGNPGQASYVAANCMVETLADWRRKNGLPVQVIGWGPIDDTGMLTRNPKARQMLLKSLGVSPTRSQAALDWLEYCITNNVHASHYFGLDWHSRADLPVLSTPRFSLLRPYIEKEQAEGFSLEDIRLRPPAEALQIIISILLEEITHVLRLPDNKLTLDTTLASLGMDSLMGVELSLAIEQKFKLEGYALPLSTKTTAADLADSIYAVLVGKKGEAISDEESQADLLEALVQKHDVHLSDTQRKGILKTISKE